MTEYKSRNMTDLIYYLVNLIYGISIYFINKIVIYDSCSYFVLITSFIVLQSITVMYINSFKRLAIGDLCLITGFYIVVSIFETAEHSFKTLFYTLGAYFMYFVIIFVVQMMIYGVYSVYGSAYKKYNSVDHTTLTDENTVTGRIKDHRKLIKLVVSFIFAGYGVFVLIAASLTDWLMPLGDFYNAEFDLSGSKHYSEKEVEQAATEVLTEQFIHSEDRKLLKLAFRKDGFNSEEEFENYRKKNPEFTKGMVLEAQVVITKNTGYCYSEGVTYHWTYTLAGTDSGLWKVISWGGGG